MLTTGLVEKMPERPRVFVSSTIRDFADLRTSVKFWLEEAGFQVLLSECNDFTVDPNSSTFQNCLSALRSSHYVIVLLGYRKGSFYDEANNVTVTRAEYREAYEMVKAGKLKLVACVRAEMEDDLRKGNFAEFEDSEFTKEFLAELRRDEEVRAATKTGGPFPKGNWVFHFREFRGLTQALLSALGIGLRLRRKALEANLLWELKSNLKELLTKDPKGGVTEWPPRYAKLQKDFSLSPEDLTKSFKVSAEQAKRLGFQAVSLGGFSAERIATSGLDQAINSGEFLEYDFRLDEYTVGEMQSSLLDLRREIARLRSTRAAFDLENVLLDVLQALAGLTPTIPAKHLCVLFMLANSLQNVRTRTANLSAYLTGVASQPFPGYLAPDTPFGGEVENLKAERPTAEDVHHWLTQRFVQENPRTGS